MSILPILVLLISSSVMASETMGENIVVAAEQKPAVDIQCFSIIFPKYHTLEYGNPYMARIKNISSTRIVIHPYIIRDVMLKEPVVKIIKQRCWCAVGALSVVTTLSGGFTAWLSKVQKSITPGCLVNPTPEEITQYHTEHPNEKYIVIYNRNDFWAKVSLGITLLGVAGTALCAWNCYHLDAELDEALLHTAIVLEPGQEVSKYFWLQAPTTDIVFDADAIEVV